MLNKVEILKYLSENKAYLKSKFFVERIALVGSYARGENTEDSDIDFIVYFSDAALTNRIYRVYLNLQSEISTHFNKKVDIIVNGKVLPAFKDVVESDAIYV